MKKSVKIYKQGVRLRSLRAEFDSFRRKVERDMGKFKGAVKDLSDAESAMEEREKAHDARDAANLAHQQEINDGLNKLVADLQAKLGDDDAAVQDAKALADRMNNFDIDVVAPAPEPTPEPVPTPDPAPAPPADSGSGDTSGNPPADGSAPSP